MAAASGDAHPWPIYNARFRLIVPLLDADGDPISPSSPDTELSQDNGTFADATNEATELATSSGVVYVDLIATELDTKSTVVKVASTGAKTSIAVLNPLRLPIVETGTAQAGAGSTITLASGASDIDSFYVGCLVNCTNDTPTNVRGQCRVITGYVGSTKVATVEAAWGTNPSSSTTYEILIPPGGVSPDQAADFLLQRLLQGGAASRVESTTARSVMNALRSLRNRWANASGTLTVYRENDSTAAWTSALTGDGAANPTIESNPT